MAILYDHMWPTIEIEWTDETTYNFLQIIQEAIDDGTRDKCIQTWINVRQYSHDSITVKKNELLAIINANNWDENDGIEDDTSWDGEAFDHPRYEALLAAREE